MNSFATHELVFNTVLYAAISTPLLMLGIRAWAEFSLTRMMRTLNKSGLTRREVRTKIKEMNPLPWEVRLLLWLKYRKTDSYYLEKFMKQFSAQKLGTAPEEVITS